MPTTYTHYAYGQEVFHKLPEELQRKIENIEKKNRR